MGEERFTQDLFCQEVDRPLQLSTVRVGEGAVLYDASLPVAIPAYQALKEIGLVHD